MKSVIYARVSSIGDRQDTTRQVNDLTEYASRNGLEVVNVFEEHISGAKKNQERPVLCECLDFCFSNSIDTLLLSELSRLGRSTWEVLDNVKRCKDSHLNLYFQKEGFSLFMEDGRESPCAAIMVSVLATAAQLERDNISFRLNSGRKRAIEAGVKMGRKEGSFMSKESYKAKYPELITKLEERKRHLEAGIRDKRDNVRAIAEDYGIATQTVQTIRKVFNL